MVVRGVAAILIAVAASPVRAARDPGSTTRVLFGSCNRVDYAQPLWEHILAREPDAWVWAGDNVYGDRVNKFDWRTGKLHAEPATVERLRELYARQRAQPGYAALRHSNVTIVGTWDDHDYGLNDGDRTFALRRDSQRLFLDFIEESAFSARRRQQGVYGSALIRAPSPTNEAPSSAERARGRSGVLVLLLDVRYHRHPYNSNGTGDFLGEEQWAWLERTLRGSRARAHVLVSGIQILSVKGVGESWSAFPDARRRLLTLLHRLRVAAPILLSGDIHMAELNAARCTAPPLPPLPDRARARAAANKGARKGAGGPGTSSGASAGFLARLSDNSGAPAVTGLIELTSSGLTHSWSRRPLPNLAAGAASDLLFAAAMHLVQSSMPWRYLVRGDDGGPARGHGPAYHLGLNFGQLDFSWDAPGGPRVRLSIVGEGGREILSRWWPLAELDLFGPESVAREQRRPPDARDWRCVPLHGGLELLTRGEVISGLCISALKLLTVLVLALAVGMRCARALSASVRARFQSVHEPTVVAHDS